MVNYGNSKIYKIERKTDNVLVYVGSTTKEYLSQRLVKHKQDAKKYFNRKVYRTVLDNDGWNNHQILLIKLYPCECRDALRSEEARFIRALNPIGNKEIPMRTRQEYYLENKDKINKYTKEYYIDNKERINEYKMKLFNCCCGSTYIHNHKLRHFKSKKHINSIPVQFKLIEEMQNNRKQYIFQPLPELII